MGYAISSEIGFCSFPFRRLTELPPFRLLSRIAWHVLWDNDLPTHLHRIPVPVAGLAVNGIGPRNSPPPTFPVPVVPLRHGTVPSPPRTFHMHPLRPVQSAPYTFSMPSIPQVNTPATPPAAAPAAATTAANTATTTAAFTGGKQPNEAEHEIMVKEVKKLFDVLSLLTYPDGETPEVWCC